MLLQVQPIPFFEIKRGVRFWGLPRVPTPSTPVAGGPNVQAGALFTEFYCDSVNGNNMYGGSNPGAVKYTSVHGNWTSATRVFTPVDGSNPAASIMLGDYANVFVDGATTPVMVARVLQIQNAVNGTITMVPAGTGSAGTAPADQTGTCSINVGGPWKGPNGATGFPFQIAGSALTQGINNLQNASLYRVRVNMLNTATYAMTAASFGGNGWATTGYTIQGYASTPGDGGRATIDGGSGAAFALFQIGTGTSTYEIVDMIFNSNGGSGAADMVTDLGSGGNLWIRCIFSNSRQSGCNLTVPQTMVECEAYGNNLANTSAKGGMGVAPGSTCIRCYSHDNLGSNSIGFYQAATTGVQPTIFICCVADSNGSDGFQVAAPGMLNLINCDSYKNGGNGFSVNAIGLYHIENCNVLRNAGAGFAGAAIGVNQNRSAGFAYNNGYGSGIQTNGPDTGQPFSRVANFTYPADTTPYVNPVTGNFSIANSIAIGVGRGAFLQTGSGKSGSVGHPDIGAVQSAASVFPPGWADQTVALPDAYVNHPYVVDWVFDLAVALTLQAGSMPGGLGLQTISTTEAQINGTPTGVVGTTYTFTIRATVGTNPVDAVFSIRVLADPDSGFSGVGGG